MINIEDINFYCINLQYREDRKNWIIQHFNDFGFPYQFYKAKTHFDNVYNLHFTEKYSLGNIGCFLSHYDLIKNYKDNKILGIFEDDALLCEDFFKRFDYINQNFNLEWDIFFMSSFYHLNTDDKRWHKFGDYEKTSIKYIHRTYGSFCTHSYLVNPKSINKIINLMDINLKESYAIDHLYILIQPLLKCYAFTPGMVTQRADISDICQIYKDQSQFEEICGKHYFVNNLNNFNYDEYFSKNK